MKLIAKNWRLHDSSFVNIYTAATESAAESTEEEGDDVTLEQLMLNRQICVARRFPHRRLTDGLMERARRVDGDYNLLHASSLRHFHMDARVLLMLRPGTLEGFVETMGKGRNIDPNRAEMSENRVCKPLAQIVSEK